MNTKLIIIVLIVIVIGGLGYGWYSHKHIGDNIIEEEIQIASLDSTETSAKKMAFSALVAQGGTYECTVKQYVSNMENEGLVFLDKGRMRGEFSTVAGGMKIDTSIITRDGYTYTWSSAMPKNGFKIKIEAPTTGDTGASTSGTYSWNTEQIGDYNCKDWSADESKFTLPSGVTFMEIKK